jgi:signal transduction histidine kinase
MATEPEVSGNFLPVDIHAECFTGGAMIAVHERRESSTAARILEKALRRLLDNPSVFSYGALAISVAVMLPRGFTSRNDFLIILVQLAAFAVWLQVWARRRSQDPTARTLWTVGLAFIGTLLLASLAVRHLGFTLVATTLLPQYFTSLSLPVAALAFVPLFIASEYSHTAAVLANPTNLPWDMAIIRGGAVILIGICFKVLAMQMEERVRLQRNLSLAQRRAGVLEERQRLAREIHDTLAQGFASIIVHFERAEQMDSLSGSPAKAHFDLARSVAREGLEDARRMLGALRPEVLEQRALPEALTRVCEEWSRRTGIQSNLSVTGAPAPMHPDIELTILRGMQEALTNVARHAGAHSAAATLSYMGDILVLDVQDDGRGFQLSAPRAGYGLTGMAERIASLRGSFSIESSPGEGTTISITLPAVPSTSGNPLTEGTTA